MRFKNLVFLTVFCGVLFSSLPSLAQDSTFVKDISEEKKLLFQEHFFKALSEKSIQNYQKAIFELETCNELLPNEVSVLFEFSKNYLLLNKTNQAKRYIEEALKIKANNLWMQEHLVSVLVKEFNYKRAIEEQKKLIELNPKKRTQLVRLYYLNRDYDNALQLMRQLESEGGLSRNLKNLKLSLEHRKGNVKPKTTTGSLSELIKQFDADKSSFNRLETLLNLAFNQDKEAFHKYSLMAIELFPAQPKSYLNRGKSLFIKKQNQEAVLMLETGLDFVVDNNKIEKQFYEQLILVFTDLKNQNKITEYKTKLAQMKNVE